MLDDEGRFVELLGDCNFLFLVKFIMVHFRDDARMHEKIWSGLTKSMEVDRRECYLKNCHTMTILKKTVFMVLYYVFVLSNAPLHLHISHKCMKIRVYLILTNSSNLLQFTKSLQFCPTFDVRKSSANFFVLEVSLRTKDGVGRLTIDLVSPGPCSTVAPPLCPRNRAAYPIQQTGGNFGLPS